MTPERAEEYRLFALNVAHCLTWVFEMDGQKRGSGKLARQVLDEIRLDLRRLRIGLVDADAPIADGKFVAALLNSPDA